MTLLMATLFKFGLWGSSRPTYAAVATALTLLAALPAGAGADGDGARPGASQPPLSDRITRSPGREPVLQSPSRIPLPRFVDAMDLRVTPAAPAGADCDLPEIPQDARQRLTPVPRASGQTVACERRVEVHAVLPRDMLRPFPLKTGDALEDARYLQASPLIDADQDDVALQAQALTQNIKPAYEAVKAIHQWMFSKIRTSPGVGEAQPASVTLQAKEGTTLDKALLMAALCRAVGIPARIAAGVEYRPLGNDVAAISGFGFHVWVEAYVSEWTGFDPTRPDWRLDAGRLKLADSDYAVSPDESSPFDAAVINRLPDLALEVTRAQAPGATTVSLNGRAQTQAIAIPQLDLGRQELQKAVQANTPTFETTPNPYRIEPNEPDGRVTEALALLSKGDAGGARRALETALTQATQPLAIYRLSEGIAALGFYELAQAGLQRAAQGDPELAALAERRVALDFPTLRLTTSEEDAYALALNKPGAAESAATLESLAGRENGFDGALLALGRMALSRPDPQAAHAWFERYTVQRPRDPRGWGGLAEASMARKRYGEAAARFSKAATLAQQSPAVNLQRLAPEWRAAQQIANARSQLTRAPKSSDAWILLGQGLSEQGQWAEARGALENARVFSAQNSRALLYLTALNVAESRWDEVESSLKSLSPTLFRGVRDRAAAEMIHAKALYRTGAFAQAAAAYRRALAQMPDDAQAAFGLADALEALGRPQQAAQALTQALSRAAAPQTRQILQLALAERLLTTSPLQAKAFADQARRSDPFNPLPYRLLATLALNAPDNLGLSEAHRRLEQALALSPLDAGALAQRGRLYERTGRVESAIVDYQRALQTTEAPLLAAQRLSALIDRLKLPYPKPPTYTPMSVKERAWLMDALSRERRFNLRQLSFASRLQALVTQPALSPLDALAKREAAGPLFDEYRSHLAAYAASTAARNAPPRFEALRQMRARLANLNLEELAFSRLTLFSLLPSPQAAGPIAARVQDLQAESARWEKAYHQEMAAILETLPPLERARLMSETNWEEHQAMVAKIAAMQRPSPTPEPDDAPNQTESSPQTDSAPSPQGTPNETSVPAADSAKH